MGDGVVSVIGNVGVDGMGGELEVKKGWGFRKAINLLKSEIKCKGNMV